MQSFVWSCNHLHGLIIIRLTPLSPVFMVDLPYHKDKHNHLQSQPMNLLILPEESPALWHNIPYWGCLILLCEHLWFIQRWQWLTSTLLHPSSGGSSYCSLEQWTEPKSPGAICHHVTQCCYRGWQACRQRGVWNAKALQDACITVWMMRKVVHNIDPPTIIDNTKTLWNYWKVHIETKTNRQVSDGLICNHTLQVYVFIIQGSVWLRPLSLCDSAA